MRETIYILVLSVKLHFTSLQNFCRDNFVTKLSLGSSRKRYDAILSKQDQYTCTASNWSKLQGVVSHCSMSTVLMSVLLRDYGMATLTLRNFSMAAPAKLPAVRARKIRQVWTSKSDYTSIWNDEYGNFVFAKTLNGSLDVGLLLPN